MLILLVSASFAYELPSAGEIIPDEVDNLLPDGIKDSITQGKAVTESRGAGEVLKYLFSALKDVLMPAVFPFFTTVGIIIICALFSNYSGITRSGTALKVYGFLSSLCLGTAASGILVSIWKEFSELSEKLITLINASSLSMVTVYALSGNVNEAAVSSSNFALFIALIGNLFKFGLFPVLQICFSFSFISSVTDLVDLTSLASLVRKTYTTVIVFIMGILTAVMSVQQVLAVRADNMLVRGVKMAAGSFIPIVGNAIGEATRTVAAGVDSLKGTLAVACLIAFGVCIVPVFLKMMITKLSFMFSGVLADVLGLKKEAGLIRSCGELINFSIALLSSVSLIFVINLMIFAGSASAAGA